MGKKWVASLFWFHAWLIKQILKCFHKGKRSTLTPLILPLTNFLHHAVKTYVHVQEDRWQNLSARFLKRDRQHLVRQTPRWWTHTRTRGACSPCGGTCGSCPAEPWSLCSGPALWSSRSAARSPTGEPSRGRTGGRWVPASCRLRGDVGVFLFFFVLFFFLISEFRGFQAGAKGDWLQF